MMMVAAVGRLICARVGRLVMAGVGMLICVGGGLATIIDMCSLDSSRARSVVAAGVGGASSSRLGSKVSSPGLPSGQGTLLCTTDQKGRRRWSLMDSITHITSLVGSE